MKNCTKCKYCSGITKGDNLRNLYRHLK
jgi:hypothetical protein